MIIRKIKTFCLGTFESFDQFDNRINDFLYSLRFKGIYSVEVIPDSSMNGSKYVVTWLERIEE